MFKNLVRLFTILVFLFHIEQSHADFLVCDFDADEVLLYDDTGAFVTAVVAAGTSPLDGPESAVIGPNGNLYVSSFNNDSIFEYTYPDGQFLGPFAFGGSLTEIFDLQFGPDGNLWVADADDIKVFDSQTGLFLSTQFTFNSPSVNIRKFRFEPSTNQLVVVEQGGFLGRYEVVDEFAVIYESNFNSTTRAFAFGTGLGPEGDLYINNNSQVLRYDLLSGLFQQTFAFSAPGATPDMEFGPNKDLFMSNTVDGNGVIERYSGSTGLLIGTFISGVGSDTICDFDFIPSAIPGDVNQDGCVDLLDVQPFVNLLTTGTFQSEGDINNDGIVDLLDVALFVDLLTN